MKLDVYDTYVRADDGSLLHFDVLIPENGSSRNAISYAKNWLEEMGIAYENIDQQNCRYCHSVSATPEIDQQIKSKGYFILQMEGCPAAV